ncbi:MAG: hypothetical protein WDO69_11725 [Pseudomonadota bacterium]
MGIFNRHRWLALLACVWLVGCGTHDPSGTENVAPRQAALATAPLISPDFAVDHDVPDFDPNATLVQVTGSTEGGYLLSYIVVHRPEPWSRVTRGVGFAAQIWSELAFMQWIPTSGAAKALARFPMSADLFGVHAVDIGTGWLVVYGLSTDSGLSLRAMVLARDGSSSPPTAVAGLCAMGVTGMARGGNAVLLTDGCGTGVLLDLAGNVLSTLTIATTSSFVSPPIPGGIFGGQVAFNGIDFLAIYAFRPLFGPTIQGVKALGFPITPAGAVATPIVIATPRIQTGETYVELGGVVANGSSFLALIGQQRTFSEGRDFSYRIVTEGADHTFTLAPERYLPGGPLNDPSAPSDQAATPLALNGHFVIARRPSSGPMQLISPSADLAVPDASQTLLDAIPGGSTSALPEPNVSTDSQGSDGKRLLFVSGSRGVRFDATLHAIDSPPAIIMPALHGQFMPSFAFAGQQYLAAWTEGIVDTTVPGVAGQQIRAERLSSTGALLDPASWSLTASNDPHTDPILTANSSFFAGMWDDDSSGLATLTTDGPPILTKIDTPYTLGKVWGVATDGVHVVATYVDGHAMGISQLKSDGTWWNNIDIGLETDASTSPAIAFNGGQYAVVWTSPGNAGERVVYGGRLGAGSELTLLEESKELFRFPCADIPGAVGHTADGGLELIASGDHFLLAWTDVSGSVEEVRVARLSSSLTLLDAGGVLVATQPFPAYAFTKRRVALGWDGGTNWVVWRDGEGGARRPYASLRGRRFSDALAPIDADSFLISNDLDEMSNLTLAVGSGGRSLVGYTRYSPSEHSYRIRARFLSAAPSIAVLIRRCPGNVGGARSRARIRGRRGRPEGGAIAAFVYSRACAMPQRELRHALCYRRRSHGRQSNLAP